MNRLEFAQNLLQQAAPTCPFLSAVDSQTRDALLEQHPDPHTLSEAKLLEIAEQHGYEVDHKNGGKTTSVSLSHDENMAYLETDFFDLEFSARTQGLPFQKTMNLEGSP
jgi:hypothetical protein